MMNEMMTLELMMIQDDTVNDPADSKQNTTSNQSNTTTSTTTRTLNTQQEHKQKRRRRPLGGRESASAPLVLYTVLSVLEAVTDALR